ncbi:hypothetical protein CGI93_23350, partial [Vibrio parahaemolyticus]
MLQIRPTADIYNCRKEKPSSSFFGYDQYQNTPASPYLCKSLDIAQGNKKQSCHSLLLQIFPYANVGLLLLTETTYFLIMMAFLGSYPMRILNKGNAIHLHETRLHP